LLSEFDVREECEIMYFFRVFVENTEDGTRKNGTVLKRRNTEYGKTEGQNHGKTRKHGTEYGTEHTPDA
jgi:hypothetical protein